MTHNEAKILWSTFLSDIDSGRLGGQDIFKFLSSVKGLEWNIDIEKPEDLNKAALFLKEWATALMRGE